MPRINSYGLNIFNSSSGLLQGRSPYRLARLLRAILLACAWCSALGSPQARAQTAPPNVQFTNKAVDLGDREDLRVNPSTLAFEIQIPLGSYPGRAGLNLPVVLSYSSKLWRLDYNFYNPGHYTSSGAIGDGFTGVVARYAEHSTSGWTSSLGFPSVDTSPIQYYDYYGSPKPDVNSCGDMGCYIIDRVVIWMPDGSSHEFRSTDQPKSVSDHTPFRVKATITAIKGLTSLLENAGKVAEEAEVVYHGTSASETITTKGLSVAANEAATDGNSAQVGLSVTEDRSVAEQWAKYRALERNEEPVLLSAPKSALPLTDKVRGVTLDPGEKVILRRDFPKVGPGVFKRVQ